MIDAAHKKLRCYTKQQSGAHWARRTQGKSVQLKDCAAPLLVGNDVRGARFSKSAPGWAGALLLG